MLLWFNFKPQNYLFDSMTYIDGLFTKHVKFKWNNLTKNWELYSTYKYSRDTAKFTDIENYIPQNKLEYSYIRYRFNSSNGKTLLFYDTSGVSGEWTRTNEEIMTYDKNDRLASTTYLSLIHHGLALERKDNFYYDSLGRIIKIKHAGYNPFWEFEGLDSFKFNSAIEPDYKISYAANDTISSKYYQLDSTAYSNDSNKNTFSSKTYKFINGKYVISSRVQDSFDVFNRKVWNKTRNYDSIGRFIPRTSTFTLYTDTGTVASTPNGISPISQLEYGIQIFPNPATDFINIHVLEFINHGTIQIMDNTGRCMASYQNLTGTDFKIMRNRLPHGVYLLLMNDENGKTYFGKIVWE